MRGRATGGGMLEKLLKAVGVRDEDMGKPFEPSKPEEYIKSFKIKKAV